MSTIKKRLPGTPRSYDVTPSHLVSRKVTRETANAPDEEAEQHTLSQYAVVPFARVSQTVHRDQHDDLAVAIPEGASPDEIAPVTPIGAKTDDSWEVFLDLIDCKQSSLGNLPHPSRLRRNKQGKIRKETRSETQRNPDVNTHRVHLKNKLISLYGDEETSFPNSLYRPTDQVPSKQRRINEESIGLRLEEFDRSSKQNSSRLWEGTPTYQISVQGSATRNMLTKDTQANQNKHSAISMGQTPYQTLLQPRYPWPRNTTTGDFDHLFRFDPVFPAVNFNQTCPQQTDDEALGPEYPETTLFGQHLVPHTFLKSPHEQSPSNVLQDDSFSSLIASGDMKKRAAYVLQHTSKEVPGPSLSPVSSKSPSGTAQVPYQMPSSSPRYICGGEGTGLENEGKPSTTEARYTSDLAQSGQEAEQYPSGSAGLVAAGGKEEDDIYKELWLASQELFPGLEE